MATLHTCNGSFNTFDDPSGRICIPNKTGEVNLNAFNMITRINESRTVRKHISCKFKFKFDYIRCTSNQKRNKLTTKILEKILCVRKIIFVVLVQAVDSIIDDSVITCEEIIEVTKTIPTKQVTCKIENVYTLILNLHFILHILLIRISILIIISICCYLKNINQNKKIY